MTKFRDFLSFMTKLLNIDTLFMTKIAEDHILGNARINMAHIRENSPVSQVGDYAVLKLSAGEI